MFPTRFSVEWQGKHLCETLYEDAQIRIGRCAFPPGAVHLCHSHPGDFGYTLSGGKGQVRDARGTRQGKAKTGGYRDSPPVPWHEYTNVGDATISYLVVEKNISRHPRPTRTPASSDYALAAPSTKGWGVAAETPDITLLFGEREFPVSAARVSC